jgi:hypothetical protein
MKFYIVFAMGVSLLTAQTRVPTQLTIPAGTQKETLLQILAPRKGDMIDTLVGDANVRITVVLPDGREVTESNAKEFGVLWETVPPEQMTAVDRNVTSLLLSGQGLHTVVEFRENPLTGDYRIRIDAKQATATSRVSIAYIPITSLLMKLLQDFPGVKITSTVRLAVGSTGTKLSLSLTAGTESAVIDIAPTDPRVSVTLRFPDGTIVNRENAKENGVAWRLSNWPPSGPSGDLFGFGAAMEGTMMLPVEGVHHQILFEKGVRKTGNYVIQVNASGSDRASEVTAMFLPLESAFKQFGKAFDEIGNPPLGSGETKVVSHGVDHDHFAMDKIDLAIGLPGVRIREPIQFSSRATVKSPGPDQQAKPIDLQIPFTHGSDGLYHGVFIPPVGGLYQITTEVRGTQESGQPFTGAGDPVSVLIFPLAARLNRLTDRAVDTDGNGRPDRLDITAHVDIIEAGDYRFDVQLQETGFPGWGKSINVTVGPGSQEMTVSFSGLELYERMKLDGPYRVSVTFMAPLTNSQTSGVGDLRNGNKLTTAPYRREDWDRGGFYGTAKITGAPVDIKGTGKFQIYRVRWDVVTPGGNCEWSGYLTPKGSNGTFGAGGKKQLAPGPATLEFDFDGYEIAKDGGQHAWNMGVSEVKCDYKPMPTTNQFSNLIQLETGVIRAEDFEPLPTGFRIKPAAGEAKLLAGGTQLQFLISVERIGQFKDPITLRLSGVPSTVKAWASDPGVHDLGRIVFYASALTPAGEYPIQVVAAGGGKEHEFTLRLVVEAPETAVASRLIVGAPAVTSTTKPAAPKSVMLLLGANSTMAGVGCDAAKLFARRFKEGLRPGVDALGMVEFATSVNVALPLTSDFEAPSQKAIEEFSRVRCAGFSSTAYALEKAHEQLKRESAKNTDRFVVMLFSIQPTAIAAKWPVRTQSDSRKQLEGPEATMPPSNCSDSQGRRYPQPGWATGGSMPDRTGALGGGQLNWINGPLAPVEGSLANPAPAVADPDKGGCGFTAPIHGPLGWDVAYLPETDLGGVPLDGPRRLARFESGPYKAKIRPDSAENRMAALSNLFDKALQSLLDDGIRVIGLYASSNRNPGGLESVFNIHGTPSFNAAKPAGMLVAIHDEEQVLPMLERVWETLGITRRP